MYHTSLLLHFLTKYLFVMQAASDGWRVCYVGGNRFEFHDTCKNRDVIEPHAFVERYRMDFIE